MTPIHRAGDGCRVDWADGENQAMVYLPNEWREHDTLSHRMPVGRRRYAKPTTDQESCLFNFIHAIEYVPQTPAPLR
jgi:hypothetical protein